jgi:hypothetical protein
MNFRVEGSNKWALWPSLRRLAIGLERKTIRSEVVALHGHTAGARGFECELQGQ